MPSKILDTNRRPAEIDQIETIIRKSLVGQDRAVKQALKIFNRMFSGIRPYDDDSCDRPLGVFMFLGPTGVGKTLLAREIARIITGSPKGLTKINCAEFQEDHEISKLIGSPPGYVGFNRTGDDQLPTLAQEVIDKPYLTKLIGLKSQEFSERKEKIIQAQESLLRDIIVKLAEMKMKLKEAKQISEEVARDNAVQDLEARIKVEEARRLQYQKICNGMLGVLEAEYNAYMTRVREQTPILSVVLFDEVEKASPALFKILLGIIDHGDLRMGNGVDITTFKNSLIIFTGNIGSLEIAKCHGVKRIGFVSPEEKSHEQISGEIYDTVYGEMTKFFSPELIGRLRRNDAIVVFEPLTPTELSGIVDVEMTKIQNVFTKDFPIVIKFEVKEYILSRADTQKYGARDIAGLMENKVFIPLCNLVASKEILVGDEIRIGVDESGNNLVFERNDRRDWSLSRKISADRIPKFFGLEG